MAMRTILIAALLAGVASPALSARPHDGDRGERRHESSEKSEAPESAPKKQERSADRPQHTERRSESPAAPAAQNRATFNARSPTVDSDGVRAVEQVHRRDPGDEVRQVRQRQQVVETREDSPRRNVEPKLVRAPRHVSETVSVEQPAGDSVRNWRSNERKAGRRETSIEERIVRRTPTAGSGDLVQAKRPVPRTFERAERRISRRPILGTEPPAPRTATALAAKPARHWRSDWRRDHRYDWRNWRRHHHSHFHFGFYSDPFGWDYFRYGVGWRLWPSYYRNSFWLNDPWRYRLPPAYGPYRWIRYYDDALLVNIYSGQVVDVEYDVFW